MKRRSLLLGGVSAPLVTALAESSWVRPTYDVVKVMSFSCPACAMSEAQDRLIEAAQRSLGGKYLSAPIPATAGDPGHRERFYYAARDISPAFAARVKASLYVGAQDRGLPLADYSQVYTWLLQDMPDQDTALARLVELAQAPAAAAALERAVRLTLAAGVQQLPTYVILERGSVVTTLDVSTAGTTSMAGLREALIRRIESLTANEPTHASNPR